MPEPKLRTVSIERRQYPRTAVNWKGTLTAGPVTTSVIIMNVSAGGAKTHLTRAGYQELALAGMLSPGSKVTLLVENYLDFHGRIAWAEDNAIGIEFETPQEPTL